MKSDNLFKVHLICVCLFVGFFVVFSSGKIKGQENKYQVPPYLYHSKMQDIYNDILCDAKSAVHLAGTSTNANVRGDANGGTARDSTKTYEYFVDATATDQGSATTMANRSIKDLVDSIEKNISATLVLTHSGSGNTTVYTLTTSETIPKNISLRIENGAILDGTGTLKINGPFECGLHQCFGSSITVSFGSGAIKEVYSEWWGIDGKSDDTEIEAAIASLPSTGGTLRLLDAKIYTLSADGIDVKDVSNLTIKGGVGTVIDGSSVITANKILDITGSLSGTSTIASASISKDDRAISITDSGGFTEGQMIFIYTATEPFSENDSSYKKGELAVIASVSAGTVTITVGARDDYDIGEGTINIAEIDPIKNFRIETLKILGRGSASEHDGLVINYAYNPRVTNIEMEDAEDNGIVFGYTLNGIIDKCAVINTDGGGAVPGYAYSFTNATSDSIIRGSFARNFRHAWTCAGKYPTWSNVVTENEFVHNVGNFGAIVPHRNSSKLSIIGNYVRDSFIGIQANGPNTLIANNNIQTNPTDGYGIYVIEDGQLGLHVINNTIAGRRGIGIDAYAGSANENILIEGNNLRGNAFGGSVLHGITTTSYNTIIQGNRITNHSPGIRVNASNCKVLDNIIVDTRHDTLPYAIYIDKTATTADNIIKRNVIYNKIMAELTFYFYVDKGADDTVIEYNYLLAAFGGNNQYVNDNGNRTRFRRNWIPDNADKIVYQNYEVLNVTGAGCSDATTDGYAKTTKNISYIIHNRILDKNATDDLFNLTKVSTGGDEYMKVLLCIDSSGGGQIVKGVKSASQTSAKIPNWWDPSWCPVGVVEIPSNYSGGDLSGYKFFDFTGPMN